MTKHAHSDPARDIWPEIRAEAQNIKEKEPVLAAFVQDNILSAGGLLSALAELLSAKLATQKVDAAALHAAFTAVYQTRPELEQDAACDLLSTIQNDPAVQDRITPFLFFKGYHALQAYRVAHVLWEQDRKYLALHLQSRASALLGVDIHPAARIGRGVMFDHATGIVVGETTVIENDVLLWHGVTLGGIGPKTAGDRHPKIRRGAQLGACAVLLGPIEVGAGARVGAGSVVLKDVAAGATVAGVPAKPVKQP